MRSNTDKKKGHNDALNYFNNLLLGFANAQQVATTPTEDDKRKSVQQLWDRDWETTHWLSVLI